MVQEEVSTLTNKLRGIQVWRATFKLANHKEVQTLSKFLKKKLLKPNRFRTAKTPYPAVVVECPSEDACFKTGVWIKNRNPIGKLNYSVEGINEKGRKIFQSGCPVCRREKIAGVERTPHYIHEEERGRSQFARPAKNPKIIDIAPVYAEGQITIPKQVRAILKLSDADKVIFSQTPDGKIVLYKA